MGQPDSTSADEDLYDAMLRQLADSCRVTEVCPGVIQIEVSAEESRRLGVEVVQIRMTSGQLRETVTRLAADGQEALGIADPVTAGWSLFSIHLEEDLATMRPGERFLLWHAGALRASTDLEWPPVRATTRD